MNAEEIKKPRNQIRLDLAPDLIARIKKAEQETEITRAELLRRLLISSLKRLERNGYDFIPDTSLVVRYPEAQQGSPGDSAPR